MLVTVTDSSALSRTRLDSLLASLERQSAEIDLVLVMRGEGSPPERPTDRIRIHPLEQPLVTGLSVARNCALSYARARDLLGAVDIVAFPDDDCVYPEGLLTRVGQLMTPTIGIVCGSYGPAFNEIDTRRFPMTEKPLSPAHAMAASSNTMFFAAPTIEAVGDFDELLGLGARYASSEDVDYILRALRHGIAGIYRPAEVFVEHPYKAHHPSAYYVGVVATLAKHALGGGTFFLLVRRMILGLGMTLRGSFPPAEYFQAIRAAGYWLRRDLESNT